jgi:hypothetical protein
MAFVVPIGAVAVAGLSAYGLWRHTAREDSEAPSELDPQQQIGANGTRHKVLYGISTDDIKNYFGTDAHQWLIANDWVDMQAEQHGDASPIDFAGQTITTSALAVMTGLEIMQAVNAAAEKAKAKPPYDLNAPLPKLVVPRDAFPPAAAAEADPAAC